MYLYSTDGLGDCDVTKKFSLIGTGIDPTVNPMNPKTGICPLIQDPMSGRFQAWLEYYNRATNPKDPLSKFKRFLNEDCFKDFQKRFCVPPAPVKPTPQPVQPKQPLPPELIREIVEALTRIRWPQLQPQTPSVPPAPKTLKMRDI